MLYLLNLKLHCMVISAEGCSTLASRDSKHVCALRLVAKSVWNQTILWCGAGSHSIIGIRPVIGIYNELLGHEFETPNAEHPIEMQNLLQM